jgi:DNA-binding beta-propeller fold protein YncE
MMSAIARGGSRLLILAVLAGLSGCSTNSPIKIPLTLKQNVQLPRDTKTPSIDLLTLDPRNGLLYVSHSSNDALDIVDFRSRKLVGTVSHVLGIKAIALSADPNIVFTSNSGDQSVSVVDIAARKVLDTIKLTGSPDAIDYDARDGIVVAGIGSDNSVAFIDATTHKLLGKLSVGGKPELFAVDPESSRIFLAINDKDQVLVIDPTKQSITKTYKGCGIKGPTGIVFDPDQQRLFATGRREIVVIDVLIEQCLGAVDVGTGTDQVAFNNHLHHLYAANSGTRNVSVIDTVSLQPLGVMGSGPGAGTIAADPTGDWVCVAVPRAGLIAIYHDP